MAKDSLESGTNEYLQFIIGNHIPKTEAPGSRVIVSFPALIKSLRDNLSNFAKCNRSNSRVDLVLVGIRSHSKNSVLTLQPDFGIRVQILRN
jgi:hypothetical protein